MNFFHSKNLLIKLIVNKLSIKKFFRPYRWTLLLTELKKSWFKNNEFLFSSLLTNFSDFKTIWT